MTPELGVAILLGSVGALLVVVIWRRRVVALRAGTFRCRIRPAGAQDGSPAWLGGVVRARWLHDVLIVEAGLFHDARQNLVVRAAHAIVDRGTRGRRRRIWIRLVLRDGSVVEVVTSRRHVDLLSGPFVTAHPSFQRPRADQSR
jgi:hypothetical protein